MNGKQIKSLIGKTVQDGRKIGVIVDETPTTVGVKFKGRGFKIWYYNKKDMEVNDEKANSGNDGDAGGGVRSGRG